MIRLKLESHLLSAALATAMTMHWLRPSTASTRPRSSIDAGDGAHSKPSNLQHWNGWTGSIIEDCWSPSETFHRPKLRETTTQQRTISPWQHNLEKSASSNPGAVQGSVFVFPRNTDRTVPISKEVMQSTWQRLRWRAQIEDVHIHDLRHTVGTYAQAGVSGFIVRDLLRHANVSTTGRYANFDASPVREVADIVGERILRAGTTSRNST
jgi:hypothetical protein